MPGDRTQGSEEARARAAYESNRSEAAAHLGKIKRGITTETFKFSTGATMADKPRVPVRDAQGRITGYRGGDYTGATERSTRGGGLAAAAAKNKARMEGKAPEFDAEAPGDDPKPKRKREAVDTTKPEKPF